MITKNEIFGDMTNKQIAVEVIGSCVGMISLIAGFYILLIVGGA